MALLEPLRKHEETYMKIEKKMRETIKSHNNGIPLSDYNIKKISRVVNKDLKRRHDNVKKLILTEMNAKEAELMELYHGSPNAMQIIKDGFSAQYSDNSNMFGVGIYFANFSSKSNQFAWGNMQGCPPHRDRSCSKCVRHLLVCSCFMGNIYRPTAPTRQVPKGFHSVAAEPGVVPSLCYPEFAVLNGDQALPLYLIEYTIVP